MGIRCGTDTFTPHEHVLFSCDKLILDVILIYNFSEFLHREEVKLLFDDEHQEKYWLSYFCKRFLFTHQGMDFKQLMNLASQNKARAPKQVIMMINTSIMYG